MDFPDRPHLEKLGKALWKKSPLGGASVMVGAGVSLNARPLSEESFSFPRWSELVQHMQTSLAGGGNATVSNTQSFLRIASEYEAAFGRKALNEVIADCVPDEKFRPGIIHERLLELPWADVFTTNYDTLLERTTVQDRAYHVVVKPDDLSRDRAPRIVKLHGSLPSQTPFIVTEEDFRTYPQKFAPFVNTVQQSLLENYFLLLGFSGDDPNFLEWIGWVRDQLGEHRSPIYLCGILNLTSPQRSLLESRGVRPIDLSFLDDGTVPSDDLHRIALEWLIEELHLAEPRSPDLWPDLEAPQIYKRPSYLREPLSSPIGVAAKLSFSPQIPVEPDQLQVAYHRWKAEREAYPGWVVAPESVRSRVWEHTKHWIDPVLSHLEQCSAGTGLLVLWEIDWRLSTALGCYLSTWLNAAEVMVDKAIGLIDENQHLDAPELEVNQKKKHLLKVFDAKRLATDLALSFARDARESFDQDRWTRWMDTVERLSPVSEATFVRIAHERVLSDLWRGKRNSAKSGLASYPECQDPFDKLRKAALHAELDQLMAARHLAEKCLKDIRFALRVSGDSVRLLSQDGWCLWVINHITIPATNVEAEQMRHVFRKRRRKLRPHHCDPWPIKDGLEEALRRPVPSDRVGLKKRHGFDPFTGSSTQHWSSDTVSQYLPGFSYVRLIEVSGLPMRTSVYTTTGESLVSALLWINDVTDRWAPGLLIRQGNFKAFQDGKVLSRNDVAQLSEEQAAEIFDLSAAAFDDIRADAPNVHGMTKGDLDSLRVVVEIMSRFAFRVDMERRSASFDRCNDLHRIPGLDVHCTLNEICEPWFKRLFQGGTDAELLEWMMRLLDDLPFDPRGKSDVPDPYRWRDPLDGVGIQRLERFDGKGARTKKLSRLIERHLSLADIEERELRNRLIKRVALLEIAGLLNQRQRRQFGELIWAGKRNPNEKPACSGFTLGTVLKFPHPRKVSPKKRIREWVFTVPIDRWIGKLEPNKIRGNTVRNIHEFFREVISATSVSRQSFSKAEVFGISWTAAEAAALARSTLAWWTACSVMIRNFRPDGGVPAMPVFFGQNELKGSMETTSELIGRVLFPFIESSDDTLVEKLKTVLEEIEEFDVDPVDAWVGALFVRPKEDHKKVAQRIAVGIQSDDRKRVMRAVLALNLWHMYHQNDSNFPTVPKSVVSLLVDHLAHRSLSCFSTAFSFVHLRLIENDGTLTKMHKNTLAAAMPIWEKETSPAVISKLSHDSQGERLDCRAYVAKCALALLSLPEFKKHPSLLAVKNLLKADPLPEVSFGFR